MQIHLPKGYRFAGVHCGVKPGTTKKDIAIVVSDHEATAAGVYTRNLVCGAPVQYDRSLTPGTGFRGVITNSGVANACTGREGLQNAQKMTGLFADRIGCPSDKTLVMSTGVIGVQLPMERIEKGIVAAVSQLAATGEAFEDAARAMMTTDTVPKMAGRVIKLTAGQEVTISGMCKGAAMIGPNMATMLAVIMTDAQIEPQTAQTMLRESVDKTFNCISVEGHTSTSDTVLFLANGAAHREALSSTDLGQLQQGLLEICQTLARMIPDDGEGVSHLITIHVTGCRDVASAEAIAKTIANDALVKTAICGADPNWGRIVSAAGRAGVPFDPNKVSLKVNGFELYEAGTPIAFDKTTVSNAIRDNKDTLFEITFGEGDAETTFWTSDLTQEYVRLNSDYTT